MSNDYILQSGTLVGLNPTAMVLGELYSLRGDSSVNSNAIAMAIQGKPPIGLTEDEQVDYLIATITRYQDIIQDEDNDDRTKTILEKWLDKGVFGTLSLVARSLYSAVMGMARGLVLLARGLILRPAVFLVRTVATALGRIVVSALATTPMGLAALAAVGGAYIAYRVFSTKSLDTDLGPLQDLNLTPDRLSNEDMYRDLEAAVPRPSMGASGSFSEEHLVNAMDAAGMTDPLERAHFLGQTMHESVGGKYPEEIWANTPAQKGYEGRKDLGNTEPGDGYRFRGSGYIHITGRANFRAAGLYLGLDLENNPDWVRTNPDIAAATAIWYWRVARPSLGKYARADNIRMVTKLINGGYNGLDDRIRRTDKYKKLTGYGQKYGYRNGTSLSQESVASDQLVVDKQQPDTTIGEKSKNNKSQGEEQVRPSLTPVKIGTLILQAEL